MQSNGGLLTASEARRNAVRTILSGPAGGIVGAVEIAQLARIRATRSLSIWAEPRPMWRWRLASPALQRKRASIDFPVRVPMLDIHTVGRGRRFDRAGGCRRQLASGRRARAPIPGPACYGTGNEATVTDAHVVLGRIDADQLVGGQMRIDASRAAEQRSHASARQLGLDAIQAAAAILRVANSNMERAIRAVSVERGEDPREFPLVAFGGCGGLHACEMAEELGVATVIVPRMAGALSALGMLLADRTRDYSAALWASSDLRSAF